MRGDPESPHSRKELLCCLFPIRREIGRSGEGRPVQPENNDQRRETRSPSTEIITEQPPPTANESTSGQKCSFEEKMKKMQILMRNAADKKELNIGIFSRSVDTEYEWLKTKLESKNSHKVRSCYIINNGYQRLMDNLSRCNFGILYHSKNRGRVNVTNVTDSLYDEELLCMYETLGKKNVIVVIDDLQDSSEEEKDRILTAQPSLQNLAKDVFLFSTDEKK